MPRAHRDAAGERLDAEIAVRMLDDPREQLAQRLAVGRLDGELRAELRLAARPPKEEESPRAVWSATARPKSSSTSANARSIPAVTPADE
jgi:hypothetical protein